MEIENIKNYIYAIPQRIKCYILSLPDDFLNCVEEIRLRVNLPVCFTVMGKPIFLLKNGQTSYKFGSNCVCCDKGDIAECFMLLTKHSVYAHTEEIKNGFVMMENGHRAGICGTYSSNGMIFDITSINIRIARQINGCADYIFSNYDNKGLLILGKPASGKTTIIRDLIRQISNSNKKVSVIDSRGEISAYFKGQSSFDLGNNTDTLVIENKAKGIEIAIRTLFPDVVAFDEIGSLEELDAVIQGFNAGAQIITTAHIGTLSEIPKREIVLRLLKTGAIGQVVILSGEIGEKPQICFSEEIKFER